MYCIVNCSTVHFQLVNVINLRAKSQLQEEFVLLAVETIGAAEPSVLNFCKTCLRASMREIEEMASTRYFDSKCY